MGDSVMVGKVVGKDVNVGKVMFVFLFGLFEVKSCVVILV